MYATIRDVPKVLKRLPRDVNARAVAIAKAAIGMDDENIDQRPIEQINVAKGRAAKGGDGRAARLSDDKRRAIAQKAAKARWRSK